LPYTTLFRSERTALLGLDRLRRVVEPTGEAEDLGDRPGDAEPCDAVVAPAGLDGDVPGVLRAAARLLTLEPGGQLSQLVAEPVRGDGGEVPLGDVLIGLGALGRGEVPQQAQHPA